MAGTYLLEHPLISIAITLAFGDLIGRVQYKGFKLGSTVGTLLVAMMIGQAGVFEIDGNIGMVGFSLCVFVIGYEAGPALIGSLKNTGIKTITLTFLFIFIGTVLTILLAWLFKLDNGTAAGVFSGSLTQTAVIATAGDAVQALNVEQTEKELLLNHISIAYGLTYFFGMAGKMLMIEKVEPWILRVDLKEEVQKTAEKIYYVDNGPEQNNESGKGGVASSDLYFIFIGVFAGLIIGSVTIRIAGFPVSVGGGVGILIVGMLMGRFAEKYPGIGKIQPGARWFLKIWGLNLFVACIGLKAGAGFITAFRVMGIKVLLIGIVVVVVTQISTLLVGYYILKMDVVDILGTQCGASSIVAALNILIEDTGSSIFALSYAPAYAIGNIVLTMMGPILIYCCNFTF